VLPKQKIWKSVKALCLVSFSLYSNRKSKISDYLIFYHSQPLKFRMREATDVALLALHATKWPRSVCRVCSGLYRRTDPLNSAFSFLKASYRNLQAPSQRLNMQWRRNNVATVSLRDHFSGLLSSQFHELLGSPLFLFYSFLLRPLLSPTYLFF